MKPARFRYHAPQTIEEAVGTLAEVAGEDGRVLAGGQSLVPIMAFRLARPRHLVDINGVAGLDQIRIDGAKLCIGACVRHAAFEKPVDKGPLGKLLSHVVQHIAQWLASDLLDDGTEHESTGERVIREALTGTPQRLLSLRHFK